MKNFDVSIYGNLILDTVHCVSFFNDGHSNESLKQYKSIGAIGNVVRELKNIDKNLKIFVYSSVGNDDEGSKIIFNLNKLGAEHKINIDHNNLTSNAVIISDMSLNKRTSIVKWGACTNTLFSDVQPSRWHHIMYLDTLTNLTEDVLISMANDGIVSADLCLNYYTPERKNWIISMLQYINYLIISDEEAKSLTNVFSSGQSKNYCNEEAAFFLGKKVKNYCIIHTPHGSTVSNGKLTKNFKTKFYRNKNINVLGAGDIFAASFINSILKNYKLDDSIEFAHTNTSNRIK